MLRLSCNETVTLIRHTQTREGDSYSCEVIVGVSWFSKRGSTASSSGEAPSTDVTVRIPSAVVPETLPKAGDYVVRGILATYTGRKSLEGREAFRAAVVGDNRRTRLLPHVVVKSQ